VTEAARSRQAPAHGARPRTAIVYDFDGTLSPGHMQDKGLLKALGVADTGAFWRAVSAVKRERDADEVLTYLREILAAARASNTALTRDLLRACGTGLDYFDGVETWFDRIDAFAAASGLGLEHYIVSAGNAEIIEGCAIHDKFKRVFACKYAFGEDGAAIWPDVAVNYTTKTQFLFRINKGIDNNWDSQAINAWMPEEDRPIPFRRIIFIGDGDTDIPSFKMVSEHGGWSIAVFDPQEWQDPKHQQKTHTLIAESRVNFVAPADYTENSQLAVVVRGILDRIARAERVHPDFFQGGAFARGGPQP
jgi:phosphoserine phosphatase